VMERAMKGREGLVQGVNCRAGEEMDEGSGTDLGAWGGVVRMIDRSRPLTWPGLYSPHKRSTSSLILISTTPRRDRKPKKEEREGTRKRRRSKEEEDGPLPTFIICSTLAYNCTFAANLHHIPLPGEAVNRSANSL
jgi:hypothetical protein